MDTESKAELKQAASDAREIAAEGSDTISAEVSKLRSELAGLVENVAQMGREKVHAITHNETISHGIAASGAAIDRTTEELRALEYDIAEATRAYPFRALGIAAAVGFLVGFLTRR